MIAKEEGTITDRIYEYSILLADDEQIKNAYKSLDVDELDDGPLVRINSITLAEIYSNIFYRMDNGTWSAPRFLVQTNRSIFTGRTYSKDNMGRAALLETCKQLHEIGWYAPIIEMLVGMAHDYEEHSMDDIKNILQTLTIKENYSVADFCQDAYLQFLNNYEGDNEKLDRLFNKEKGGKPNEESCGIVPKAFDLFNCKEEDRRNGLLLGSTLALSEKPSVEDKTLVDNWMIPLFKLGEDKTLYESTDLNIITDYLFNLAYEEKIVEIIREANNDNVVYLAEDEEQAVSNAINMAKNEAGKRDEFKFRRKAIGPVFSMTKISSSSRDNIIMSILSIMSIEDYNETLERLIISLNVGFELTLRDAFKWIYELDKEPVYSLQMLFIENENDDDRFRQTCKAIFDDWDYHGKNICAFVDKMSEIIDARNPEDTRQFSIDSIIVGGLMVLYTNRDYENALKYIVKNNVYITNRKPFDNVWSILVTRCFFHANNLEHANILLGAINEIALTYESLFNNLKEKAQAAIGHIEKSRELVKSENYGYQFENILEEGVLSDGTIDNVIRSINSDLITNSLTEPYLFSDLFRYANILYMDEDLYEYGAIRWPLNEEHSIRRMYETQERLAFPEEWFSSTESYVKICDLINKQEEFKYVGQDRTLLASGIFASGVKRAKLLATDRIHKLQDAALEGTVTEITKLRKELLAKGDGEEEIIKELASIVSGLNERTIIKDSQWETVENKIKTMERDFFDSVGISIEESMISKMGEKAESLLNSLITSERVFTYLSKTYDNGKSDYSAAIISMTNGLELVLNTIYKKGIALNGEDNIYDLIKNSTADQNRLIKEHKPKERLELWDAISLFTNGSKKKGANINLTESKKPHLFEALSLGSIIDLEKLFVFSDCYIAIDATHSIRLNENNSERMNRCILGWGMDYIRDPFRNKTAHPEDVSKNDAEECRRLLINGENLLWILLYILK